MAYTITDIAELVEYHLVGALAPDQGITCRSCTRSWHEGCFAGAAVGGEPWCPRCRAERRIRSYPTPSGWRQCRLRAGHAGRCDASAGPGERGVPQTSAAGRPVAPEPLTEAEQERLQARMAADYRCPTCSAIREDDESICRACGRHGPACPCADCEHAALWTIGLRHGPRRHADWERDGPRS